MSKYKVGDKVVLTVTGTDEIGCLTYYVLNGNFNLWGQSIDKYAEPLSTYTEPLEAKIKRQAAEITRLLAENEKLKAENGNVVWEIEQAFDRGFNEAWELARKGMLMSSTDREVIFGSGCNAMYGVLMYHTYPEAAARVAEWEKAKEEICVGDVVRFKNNNRVEFCVTDILDDSFLYGIDAEGGVFSGRNIELVEKTGRHLDIDSFLKQIGEE